MSPPDGDAPRVANYAEMIRSEFESVREQGVADRLAALEALLQAKTEPKPSWWSKWLEPGPLLAVSAMFGGFFLTYQQDRNAITTQLSDVRASMVSRSNEQAGALTSLASELHANSEDDKRRTDKYGPMVEANKVAIGMQQLVNDQMNDRIGNLVKSVQDLRASVDALRDMEQKTREELLVDKARREGRLTPGRAPGRPDEAQPN